MNAKKSKLASSENQKRRDQLIHFKRRCEQRLGFIPTKVERTAWLEALLAGDKSIVKEAKQSARVSRYRTQLRGIDVILTFDHQRKQFVTVWPVGSPESEED